jgi:hypothetical protein
LSILLYLIMSDVHCMRKRYGQPFTGVSIFLKKESHIVTNLAKELASFLKINDISFLGTSDCHHCCSIAGMLIIRVDRNYPKRTVSKIHAVYMLTFKLSGVLLSRPSMMGSILGFRLDSPAIVIASRTFSCPLGMRQMAANTWKHEN